MAGKKKPTSKVSKSVKNINKQEELDILNKSPEINNSEGKDGKNDAIENLLKVTKSKQKQLPNEAISDGVVKNEKINRQHKHEVDYKAKPTTSTSLKAKIGPKRKASLDQVPEAKKKKSDKASGIIAIDNRTETPGIVMIKGRDIVIGGLFGLGPDREQLTNLTELKNLKFKLISAGSMHVLGVTDDGKLMSWGCNDEGALGRDTSVEDSETRPGIVHIFEENSEIYSISAGGSHSAILFSNGNVYAWGTFRDKNGDMGFHPNGQRQLTPKFVMGNVRKIASGINHLVMLSKNKVYTMGCGDEGQLGRICQRHSNRESRVGKQLLLIPQLLSLRKKVEDIWANYDTTFLRVSDSTVYSFGLNAYGQLGIENDERCVYFPKLSQSLSRLKIKSISAGTQHVTLLDEQGAVYVLGDYRDGRLGMDVAENQKVPKVLPSLPQVKIATCGSDNNFVITENNKLMAWGIGFEEKDDTDVIYYAPTDIDAANKLDQKTVVQATSSDTAVFLLLKD
ncbi:regulator of chromosome condensation-like isoform X2 [Daktulosphaira vitifoliae]|uniref:regulator of chromosome condensation-like isoform X2 n=1 Tax=Daktulosphaira vitifoliae TaxID=58002 RepID=UPI0021A9FFEB|nr:regulator of chromosome condensation-like isoform X2 [Daktulosphaira vitifoliae]